MNFRYCYWSVCDGVDALKMERCVASARSAGVFKEFHVLTDRTIGGAECYEAGAFDKTGGLYKLIFLKAAISKLSFDYLVWIDPDTLFVRNPRDLLKVMRVSPIHVPLLTPLAEIPPGARVHGMPSETFAGLMRQAGVRDPVYASESSFWIVRRDAIDSIHKLALDFRGHGAQRGIDANAGACLSYVMHMLCASPEAHERRRHPDLWASDALNHGRGAIPDSSRWRLVDPFTGSEEFVNPAIVHLTNEPAPESARLARRELPAPESQQC